MDASSEATFTIQDLLSSDPSKVPPITLRQMDELISEQVKSATKLFRDISLPMIEQQLEGTKITPLDNQRGIKVYSVVSGFGNWRSSLHWFVSRDGRWYRATCESHAYAGRWLKELTSTSVEEFLDNVIRCRGLNRDNMPLKILSDISDELRKPLETGADNAHKRETDIRSAVRLQQAVSDFISSINR